MTWPMRDFDVKDYIDQQFNHHNDIHVKDEQQLKLQAEEYERRLTELNHAHARAETDRHQYITIAVYDATQKDVRALIESQRTIVERANNQTEINARDIARLTNTLTWITRTVVGAILVAIVALLLQGTITFP